MAAIAPRRRWPLWTTLVPLVAGIAVWAVLWTGYRRDFEATLAAVLPPDTAIETGGFPYRLEATVAPLAIERRDVALVARLEAARATANRVPWQPARTVLSLEETTLALALAPIRGATIAVSAAGAQASLRMESGRIARLSAVWTDAVVETGLLPVPARAASLEAHLRETPATGSDPRSPRLPTQDQLVIAGTDVRFGRGEPVDLKIDAEVTAPGPVASLAGWQQGGTIEIRSAVLSDATGEVARLEGTIVPSKGGLRFSGTVETVCPASVRAAVAGGPQVVEQRSRRPERFAMEGPMPGGMMAAPRDAAKPLPPVRGQEPPCPRLH
jgi:hypothetical protein